MWESTSSPLPEATYLKETSRNVVRSVRRLPGEGRPADLPLRLVLHRGLCLQHLLDAVGAGLSPGELEQGHGHHHHAHEDLHDVVDEGLEVAQFKGAPHDHASAEVEHRHCGPVEGQHHHRHDRNDPQAHRQSGVHQLIVGLLELDALVALPDKGLHHSDGHQILLERIVQVVDLGLHGLKELGAHLHQNADHQHHQRNDHHQHQCQPGVQIEADTQGGHQHHWSPYQHPQTHGQHHGHGIDIVGHTGDEGGGGETVNVRKGELLHLVEEALAQIGAKALTGKGRILGRQHTAQHGHARQHQHHRTQLKNVSLVAGWDGCIHDLCHDQGQQQLTDDLHHDEDGRPDRLPLVALQVGQKQLKQIDHLPFLVF